MSAAILTPTPAAPVPIRPIERRQGDEIVVAGEFFHTGTRIVTWLDTGGYNAYLAAKKPVGKTPARPAPTFGSREAALSAERTTRLHGTGGELVALQGIVDQLVLHYDGCGLSKICFDVLQNERGLSIHFLLDVDGTVYQTLDLRERALHATTSNNRSIGIEIANVGAYPPGQAKPLDEWYVRDRPGQTRIRIPKRAGDPGIFTRNFTGRPARDGLIRGAVQGVTLVQYDFTPEQYAALARLTAALGRVFPRINRDYPRDATGKLVSGKLADDKLASYHGILGHFHIQANKDDPGPAFQWDKFLDETRRLAR